MLTACPECELQVSDKALSCPHCGYPLKETAVKKTAHKTSKYKRLPNGFGQITELKNPNLRNRFRAMVSVGKNENGRPICKLLKPKAYFKTYNEAYTALIEYNKSPFDLNISITMKELYEKWSNVHYKNIVPSTVRGYKSAWKYCECIYDMDPREIRTKHIKACIEDGVITSKGEKRPVPPATTKIIKIILNCILDYAVENDYATNNVARNYKHNGNNKDTETKSHLSFTEEEIKILWKNENEIPYIKLLLFQCYSGMRPQELGLITLDNVFLDKGYLVGGMKTESGKDRIIPIHDKVRHIVEEEYNRSKQIGSPWLFSFHEASHVKNFHLTYKRYYKKFISIMKKLDFNIEHKPHDGRKTFITLAKKYKIDEYAIKYIVGHTIRDLTEKVYTDRDPEWLISEIRKIM